MSFYLEKNIEIIERTPHVLEAMLSGISDYWIMREEAPGKWSVYDVIGHFIHGEKTDWIPRMEIILSDREDKTFEPFDRFAQFEDSKGKSFIQLLDEFKALRSKNVALLKSRNFTVGDYSKEGIHPEFGTVTLAQLLSTWAVHDLAHLAQITRIMAKQHKTDVGPWSNYIGLINQ